jgi:hypothetical protein
MAEIFGYQHTSQILYLLKPKPSVPIASWIKNEKHCWQLEFRHMTDGREKKLPFSGKPVSRSRSTDRSDPGFLAD